MTPSLYTGIYLLPFLSHRIIDTFILKEQECTSIRTISQVFYTVVYMYLNFII